MDINKVLDTYNEWIKEKYDTKTHFVLKKEVINNKVTKSLRTIKYSLWYVNGKNIYEVCFHEHILVGATEFKEQLAKNWCESQIIRTLFRLATLDEFNDMMDGKFKGFNEAEA